MIQSDPSCVLVITRSVYDRDGSVAVVVHSSSFESYLVCKLVDTVEVGALVVRVCI